MYFMITSFQINAGISVKKRKKRKSSASMDEETPVLLFDQPNVVSHIFTLVFQYFVYF